MTINFMASVAIAEGRVTPTVIFWETTNSSPVYMLERRASETFLACLTGYSTIDDMYTQYPIGSLTDLHISDLSRLSSIRSIRVADGEMYLANSLIDNDNLKVTLDNIINAKGESVQMSWIDSAGERHRLNTTPQELTSLSRMYSLLNSAITSQNYF